MDKNERDDELEMKIGLCFNSCIEKLSSKNQKANIFIPVGYNPYKQRPN